ncbi:MAG: hypothetical protein QGF07_03905 [Phycisphaerales bacterium]|nr:hypothetical protein [Phycisphaerales bacterium]
MNKKKFSRVFVIGAIAIIACPFILEYVFHVRPRYILRPIGISFVLDQYWFFAAGGLLLIATVLQFPFREEEAWHCECGYDLSYLNKSSSNCPECGLKVQLEWSSTPGVYSRKTTNRLYWTIFLFIGSLVVFGIGLLTKLINSWANC